MSLLKKLDTGETKKSYHATLLTRWIENYNVVVVSPRNYFLFTPLLPSCTTGTVEHRKFSAVVGSLNVISGQ